MKSLFLLAAASGIGLALAAGPVFQDEIRPPANQQQSDASSGFHNNGAGAAPLQDEVDIRRRLLESASSQPFTFRDGDHVASRMHDAFLSASGRLLEGDPNPASGAASVPLRE